MSRESTDEIKNGRVFNGFDYSLQVWVRNGVILDCAHPERMGARCCNQRIFAGRRIESFAAVAVDLRSVSNPSMKG